MMRIEPIQFDTAALDAYGALFAACFPVADKFNRAYLEWLYLANPDGRAVGFDAWDGDQLAAHYVTVPARALVAGAPARVLLSLNTATAPAYQGKGLFTRLAEATYEAAAEQGFDGVYGVANANSTPGFIRKLGFQLVRPLEARIGVGGLRHGPMPPPHQLSFQRSWDDASIAWRCANPNSPVHVRRAGDGYQFHAAAFGALLPAYAELPAGRLAIVNSGPAASPLRLFIGLAPDVAASYVNFVSIPQRLRPSPLNLIYRSFAPQAAALDPARIDFSFLDFDAY